MSSGSEKKRFILFSKSDVTVTDIFSVHSHVMELNSIH